MSCVISPACKKTFSAQWIAAVGETVVQKPHAMQMQMQKSLNK